MNNFIFLVLILIQTYPRCLLLTDDPGKCYGDLGCFPIYGDYFDRVYRPLTTNPKSPEEINTTYHLFTRKNPTVEQYVYRHNPGSIRNSNFDPVNKVKIIIHGLDDGIHSGWMRNMTKKILQVDDVNVIIVDWSSGSVSTRYEKAIANIRLVGREVGNLIKVLKEDFNIKYKDIHLIGHSLGAHVSGYAGAWLNKPVLGRITGLDPAGIFFNNMKPTVRLDPTDALFVDVIHTNGKKELYTSIGMYNATGHVDFYPDGGGNSPSCKDNDFYGITMNLGPGLKESGCSHVTAIQLYIQSIDKSNPFAAYACDSFKSYREAKCYTCERPGHDCTSMGYYSNRYDHQGLLYQKFYLTTNKEGPLCVFQWVIEIVTSEQQKETSGNFYLLAEGENWNLTKRKLNMSPERISENKTYRYLLEFERNPGTIKAIKYTWKHQEQFKNHRQNAGIFSSNNTIMIQKIKITPMYFIDKSDRKEKSVTFCDSFKAIKAGEMMHVKPGKNC